MDTVFRHVNGLAGGCWRRTAIAWWTLRARDAAALHEHAGDRRGAEALARANVHAFGHRANYIVVNSAGCGALLKRSTATCWARGQRPSAASCAT